MVPENPVRTIYIWVLPIAVCVETPIEINNGTIMNPPPIPRKPERKPIVVPIMTNEIQEVKYITSL